jgi:hypothetical protein
MPAQNTTSRGRVAFEIDTDQHARILEVVAWLRRDPGDPGAAAMLIDVVLDLTDTGLSYFFLHPLELTGVSTIRRKGVEVALGTASRVLPPVVRSTVGSMSQTQLLKLADFIEQMVGVQEETHARDLE